MHTAVRDFSGTLPPRPRLCIRTLGRCVPSLEGSGSDPALPCLPAALPGCSPGVRVGPSNVPVPGTTAFHKH